MNSLLDKFSLAGSTALITGASGGLGAHFASVLADAGASVVVAARSEARLRPVVDAVSSRGGRVRAVEMDVSQAASVRQAADEICSVTVPDIVVNNAGITVTRPLLEQTDEDFDRVLGTNLRGSWLVATEMARRMVLASVSGSIVNVASILGERVAGGVAPYAISKAGVLQATKAMALELARHGIRVNALLPGYIETELNSAFLGESAGQRLRQRIPTRRFGCAGDLDGPLLLLASAAGAAMTGTCLVVDHGHLVSTL